MSTPRRVCVVTATRAEYGLLRHLIHELAEDKRFDTAVVVTGTHLSAAHGMTVNEIEADGAPIVARVDMHLGVLTSAGLAASAGRATGELGQVFDEIEPDLIVVLGDRFELLSVAQAALLAGIPIVHIHGGEITEGAFDDAIRHAMTKLSHIHFVASKEFETRVRQLGEEAWRIHNVGAIGLDAMSRTPVLDRPDLSEQLGWDCSLPYAIVTIHPETLSPDPPEHLVQATVDVLDMFPDLRVIITGPNADPGGETIYEVLTQWNAANPHRSTLVKSLGALFHSALVHSSLVIGNSSSGIIEAPFAHVPTVDIGRRQRGRPAARSVIQVPADASAIAVAIDTASSIIDDGVAFENLYGRGDTIASIIEALAQADMTSLLTKQFVDLPQGNSSGN